MIEKIPELDTCVGIGGSPNCPRGNAKVRNFNSQSTQPRDLKVVNYVRYCEYIEKKRKLERKSS